MAATVSGGTQNLETPQPRLFYGGVGAVAFRHLAFRRMAVGPLRWREAAGLAFAERLLFIELPVVLAVRNRCIGAHLDRRVAIDKGAYITKIGGIPLKYFG